MASRIMIFAAVNLAALCSVATFAQSPTAETGELFQAAIDRAQDRTVKIYGAGVGRQKGYATGIIVSDNGNVLTAQGIFLSGSSIRVVLPDGSLHYGKVLRRDDSVQAALLQVVAADGETPIKTPNFYEIKQKCPAAQGDWLLAVTNLFKVADGPEKLSVCLGIVSLRTTLDAKRGTLDVPYHGQVLLIDAITANPGAPGGAAIMADGQLAGMVGRRFESKTTGTAMNYVVPCDELYQFVTSGEKSEPVVTKPIQSGDTGIRLFTLAGKRAPAYIDRVAEGSSAAKAGLQKDDLVLSLDGEIVRNVRHYQQLASELPADKEVVVILKRGDSIVSAKITPTANSGD